MSKFSRNCPIQLSKWPFTSPMYFLLFKLGYTVPAFIYYTHARARTRTAYAHTRTHAHAHAHAHTHTHTNKKCGPRRLGFAYQLMSGNVLFPRYIQDTSVSHFEVSHFCCLLYVVSLLGPLTSRARCDNQRLHHVHGPYVPCSGTHHHQYLVVQHLRQP